MSSYIDHRSNGREVTHCWAEHTHRALAWRYGAERADRIIAGDDSATLADLARYRRLGRRSAA